MHFRLGMKEAVELKSAEDELVVRHVATANLPTKYGHFKIWAMSSEASNVIAENSSNELSRTSMRLAKGSFSTCAKRGEGLDSPIKSEPTAFKIRAWIP